MDWKLLSHFHASHMHGYVFVFVCYGVSGMTSELILCSVSLVPILQGF